MKLDKKQNPYFNRLFARLMIFTSLITIAAVFLSSILPYRYLSNDLRADTMLYHHQRLANVKTMTDSTVFAPMLAALSDTVMYCQTYASPSSAGNGTLSNATEIYNMLKQKTAQYALDDLSIYFERGRLILSAAHGVKFLDDMAVELPFDFGWIQALDELPSGRRASMWLSPRDMPQGLNMQGKRFSYVSALRQGQDALYVCVSMRDTNLVDAMSRTQSDSSTDHAVIDSDGTVIAGGPVPVDPEKIRELIPEHFFDPSSHAAPLSAMVDGDVVSLLRSEYCDWYYMAYLPESFFYAHNAGFRQTVLLVCICIVLAILVICLFFTLSVSYPFGKLAARIKQAGYPLEKSPGPFGNIEDVFTGLLEEVDMHVHLTANNMEIIRRSFFGYLLQGQALTHTALAFYLDFLQIKVNDSQYLACSLYDKSGQAHHDALCKRLQSNFDLLIDIKCGEGRWALILSGNVNELDVKRYCQEIMNDSPEYAHVYVAVGAHTHEIQNIRKSYLESLNALQYASYFPDKHVFTYSEARVWEGNRELDQQLEKRFVSALQERQGEAAQDCLGRIQNAIQAGPVAYQVYANLAERLVQAIESLAEHGKIDMGELYNKSLSEQLSEIFFLQETFDFIASAAKNVLAHIDNACAPISVQYAQQAIKYINENYHTEISIQDLADRLGISRYHLCRVFKQTKNITLMEYISDLRMKKANELLEETTLMIRDIASISGFNNITYFNKRYKQYFGVTPSQKRKKW